MKKPKKKRSDTGPAEPLEQQIFEMKNSPVAPLRNKACWYNAQEYAYEDPDRYGYVEGYALPPVALSHPRSGEWVAHAWVLDLWDGQAFDPTWRETGRLYLGAVIPPEQLREYWHETNGNGGGSVLGLCECAECKKPASSSETGP